MRFRVCEVVWYDVEAETCEDAIETIVQSEEPNEFFLEVADRYAEHFEKFTECNCPACSTDEE